MSKTIGRPWHLWVVGILGLLWNASGGMDFVLTQGGNANYLANFSEAERAFFTGIPFWAVIFWALSLLGGILGCIALLFKSKLAVPLQWLSLLGFIIVAFRNYLIASPSMQEVVGTGAKMFSAVILAVIVGLLIYSIKMQKRGVLS